MTVRKILTVFACLMISIQAHSQADINTQTAQEEWNQLEKDDFSSLEKKANAGNARAQFMMASRYICEKNISFNEGEAFYWIKKSANQGLIHGRFFLGLAYLGMDRKEEGLKLIEESAQQGFRLAQINQAHFFQNGIFVEKNLQSAFYWNLRASKQGSYLSQLSIPSCEEIGGKIICDPDIIFYQWKTIALKNPETPEEKKETLREDIQRMEESMSLEDIEIAKQKASEFTIISEFEDNYMPLCFPNM